MNTQPPDLHDFEHFFEVAPISLWLEDYSALKTLFSQWRAQGVTDLRAHLSGRLDRIAQCTACYRVVRVNQKTLSVFGAPDQASLLTRLADIFRGDMLDSVVQELDALWQGQTEVTTTTVNYTLDDKRLDVQVNIRILPGHESDWSRVMVALQDISPEVKAQQELVRSERYARDLFEHSPVSLWVEDFSGVKQLLDEARRQGIQDFAVFLNVHPDFVVRCMEKIQVLDVNQQTLTLFAARDKSELLGSLGKVFRGEMQASFADQLLDLWSGKLVQQREVINYALTGELINIHLQFAVLAGHEERWDLVLVSLVDITARKKAEAYLEYLGKHDSLTGLGNRAFYTEELNRMARKGPWPLALLAIDLNGLKTVNDNLGHAAGDALLRRAGEVLKSATEGMQVSTSRVGGDEFMVLMPGSDARAAQGLIQRIEGMVDLNNQFYPGQRLSMAIGIGVCENPSGLDVALGQADRTMFDAKARHYADNQLERRRS
ncbi:MAG: sensor domain-containing diguanylate cyclase [Rhodoferax sp.]